MFYTILRNRCFGLLFTIGVVSFAPTFAESQDLQFAVGNDQLEFSDRDREATVAILDAARMLELTGNQEVAGEWPGIAVPEDAERQQPPSYGALIPNLKVDQTKLMDAFSEFEVEFSASYDLQAALSKDGVFTDAYEAAKSLRLEGIEGVPEDDAYAAYVRGIVLLNSQMDKQSEFMGRSPGIDQKCWWPFCPWIRAGQ